MKPEPNPPRLVHSSEFADILRKASQRDFSSERLASTGEAIRHGIAGLSSPANVSLSSGAAGGMGKLLGALAIAGMVGTGALLWTQRGPETVPTQVEDARPPIEPQTATPPPVDIGQGATRAKPPQAASAAESNLPQQLALLQAAREAASRGGYARALTMLDQLESEFPTSPVLVEARIARVEYLAADGRLDESLTATEQLLSDRTLGAKKPALLRLQGDLLVRKGSCRNAVIAYRRAIGLGLTDDEMAAAKRGIEFCESR